MTKINQKAGEFYFNFKSINNNEETLYNVSDLVENGTPIDSEGDDMVLTGEAYIEKEKLHTVMASDEEAEQISMTIKKRDFPLFFKNKIEDFVNEGMTEEKAKEYVGDSIMLDIEIMYEQGFGYFGVEAEAIASGANIYSPFSCREIIEPTNESE